jgi:hypothetical protein
MVYSDNAKRAHVLCYLGSPTTSLLRFASYGVSLPYVRCDIDWKPRADLHDSSRDLYGCDGPQAVSELAASGGISGGVDTEPAIEQGGVTGMSRA